MARRSIVCAPAGSVSKWSKPALRVRRLRWFATLTREGYRKFIAVGGDGTSYEVVNGLFPSETGEPATLAFLPLGTGNSFLRDFSDRGVEFAIEALLARRSLPCDVLRLTHQAGVLHYINLLSMGFSADVATLRARRFSGWGEIGYQSSIFISLARFRRRPFPLRVDGERGSLTAGRVCSSPSATANSPAAP